MVVSGTIALGHFDQIGLDLVAAMLAAGFLSDVISDVHGLSINGPAFDQLAMMSKFFCLGMDLIDVVRASTACPAAALGRTDLGRLEVGAICVGPCSQPKSSRRVREP
jgi:dihydroorotase